ncbi:MAG: hypothetical protein ACUVTH_01675, partial [Thermogutta sp.]
MKRQNLVYEEKNVRFGLLLKPRWWERAGDERPKHLGTASLCFGVRRLASALIRRQLAVAG